MMTETQGINCEGGGGRMGAKEANVNTMVSKGGEELLISRLHGSPCRPNTYPAAPYRVSTNTHTHTNS